MEERPDITAGPRELAGVWANSVELTRGQHEFTLDFIQAHEIEQAKKRFGG